MRKIPHFFVCLFFLLLTVVVWAQNSNDTGIPFIRNFGADEYNAHPQNWAVLQDQRRVMYFGNGKGILEFDGKYWSIIPTSNTSFVRSMAISPEGRIYVGASGELGFLGARSNGKMEFVSLRDKIKKEDRAFSDVLRIHVTKDGVYFVTPLHVYRWFNETMQTLPFQIDTPRGLYAYNELFVVPVGKGISVIRGNHLIPLPYCESIYKANYGNISILPYPDGQLLIATTKGNFFLYDLKLFWNPLLKSYDFSKKGVPSSILKPFKTEISEYISSKYNGLSAAIVLRNGQFAFGTHKGGIVFISRDGHLTQVINKNRGLKDNTIWDMYEDFDNNLWVALNAGIAHIEINSPVSFFDDHNGFEGLPLTVTRFDGKLIVGLFNQLAYLPEHRLELKNDSWLAKTLIPGHLGFWDFIQVNGALLVPSDRAVWKIDKNLKITSYATGYGLCFGKSPKFPDVIFLGMKEGLSSLTIKKTGSNGSFDVIYNGKFKDNVGEIRKIVSDSNGDLWISSEFLGIYQIQFTGPTINDYVIKKYTKKSGLPSDQWNFVHYINNRLLVTTIKGIYERVSVPGPSGNRYVFQPEKEFAKAIPNEFSDLIGITAYKGGYIVNANHCIGQINVKPDGSYEWIYIPLKEIPNNTSDIFLDGQKALWIPSSKGLYRFDFSVKKDYKKPFYTLIRRVMKGNNVPIFDGTYFDKSSQWTDVKSNVHHTVYRSSSLEQPEISVPKLEYKDNSLIFEFATTFYEHANENRFRYILEGFDEKWSDWTDQHKKEYTNLPEGSYRFIVKAKNIYEKESKEAVFSFKIFPPWYRTTPAYIVWILFGIASLAGVAKLYLSRKESETKLREGEEKFKIWTEKSVVGICILQDHVLKYANPRFNELMRYASHEVIGKSLTEWVIPLDAEVVHNHLEMQMKGAIESEAFEFRGLTGDGRIIYLEGRGTVIHYEGKPALLETIIDISDRKKTEDELVKSSKLETIGILSGGIAHDFNNLLTIIVGNLSMAETCGNFGENPMTYILQAEKAAAQAADLVKNFITLSTGGWINQTEVSLKDIFYNIEDFFPQLKNVPHSISIPGDLKLLYGDERQLRQVIENLLSNAYESIEYPKGKPVLINIDAENVILEKDNPYQLAGGEYIKISVSDTGKGIPSSLMDKIFDPYFSTKTRGSRKGMGMGLAISYAIIKRHRGHIGIVSEIDKGTTVTIFLPVYNPGVLGSSPIQLI